jgi:hypothetical protein
MITKNEIKELIRKTNGKFFTVSFRLKDTGELKTACGKNFVRAALAGGVDKLANSEAIAFFDVNKKGYRSFLSSNLVDLKCGNSWLFRTPNLV